MNVAEVFERQAMQSPDRLAVRWRSQEASYRDFLKMVLLLAGRLQEAGIGPGHRIGNTVSNPVSNMALTLAIAHLGAVSVSLPTPVSAESLEATGRASGMTHLVHARETPFDNSVVPPERQFSFAALSAKPEAGLRVPPLAQMEAHDLWRITLSSGTTGAPKGIERSHGGSCQLPVLTRGLIPTGPQDRVLIAMDVAMNFAVHHSLRALYSGACVLLPQDLKAETVLKAIHEEGATQLVTTTGVALSLARLAQDPASSYHRPAPSLKVMNAGGAAVSPQLTALLREHVCPDLYINYGAAETGLVAMSDAQLQARDPACSGRLVPWIEAQATGEDGKPLPTGQVGRLRFRGAGLATRYCDGSGAEAFEDGWFQSNDIGRLTLSGLIYLDGRENEVLNLAGVKIDPARLEAVIQQDPAIIESAAVLLKDALGGPVLVAVVVAPGGPVDAEALKERCARALGVHARPKAVITVPSLPRNDAGKIQREVLRRKMRLGTPDKAEPA